MIMDEEITKKRRIKVNRVHFIFWYIFLSFYFFVGVGVLKGVDLYFLLLLILIIYVVIFKRFYLIKNAFLPKRNELKIIAGGSIIFLVPFLIRLVVTKGFTPCYR